MAYPGILWWGGGYSRQTRGSYGQKGKSGVTFGLLSCSPSRDESECQWSTVTDADGRCRLSPVLPLGGPGVPSTLRAQRLPTAQQPRPTRATCRSAGAPPDLVVGALCAPVPLGIPLSSVREEEGSGGGPHPLQHVTSVQPRTARPWASASPNRMQVRSPPAWPAGGSPAVAWSRSRLRLRRRDSSPSVRREALQVHPHPWL